jgi:hypothetical protein
MFYRSMAAAGLALSLTLSAHATVVGAGAFTSSAVIDFETAPEALINGFYAGLGVTMTHISGGNIYATSDAAASHVGSNFFEEPGYPNGELQFSSLMSRVGMDITTSEPGATTIYAYRGLTLVGSEPFTTGGLGFSGSFIGVEFLSGFDRIVIDTANSTNGAFAIDNLRFDQASAVPEPEALALMLAGLSVVGLMGAKRRSWTGGC